VRGAGSLLRRAGGFGGGRLRRVVADQPVLTAQEVGEAPAVPLGVGPEEVLVRHVGPASHAVLPAVRPRIEIGLDDAFSHVQKP